MTVIVTHLFPNDSNRDTPISKLQ